MPLIFGDHMVLQQDAKLPVWGWADAGEKVTVTFAGQTVSATAAVDGTWRADLAPVKVSDQGQVLTIAGKNTIAIQDVVVGDVWVASGQSNMEFGIKKPYFADDIAKSDDPMLRLFWVPKVTALDPQKDIKLLPNLPEKDWEAKWVLCTPEALSNINGQGFASAAYFFARDMRKLKNYPFGIIESSWGGTRAEVWTSLDGLKKDAILDHYVKMQAKNVADEPELEKTWPERQAAWLAEMKTYNEEVDKPYNVEHNTWRKAAADAQTSGQPIPPEPKPSKPRPSNPQQPGGGSNGPSNLFNAMISPLIPFSIKGVIWYQGEFNSGYEGGHEYATLFPRMITDWREHWGQGDFPFIFVQLPNLGAIQSKPQELPGSWVWVRESQLKTLSLPNTGMAITIDIGDPLELHPPDKPDVGHRLALEVRRVAYGETLASPGPLYDSMKIDGTKAVLSFKNTGSGLTLGISPYVREGTTPPPPPTKLAGFVVAGEDKTFYWADAVIDGNTVIVSSDKVPAPVSVRYDFAESPKGNLYNKDGLPASPFRTDDWEH